jgi:hypothetical protein
LGHEKKIDDANERVRMNEKIEDEGPRFPFSDQLLGNERLVFLWEK